MKCRGCGLEYKEWHDGLCVECFPDEYDKQKGQNERLKKMLNEIRGKAWQESFSSEPSSFAAWCLKVIEDGHTEKKSSPECSHVWKEDGDRDVCEKCGTRTNPFI